MQLSYKVKLYQHLLQQRHHHGWTGLLVLFFVGVLCLIAFNLPYLLDSSSKARTAEGKVYVSSLNKAQTYFYDDHGKFAQSISPLETGIPEKTQVYTYSIKATQKASFQYAIANPRGWFDKPPVTSFVGAVFLVKSGNNQEIQSISILCRNNIKGHIQPPDPVYKNGVASCPSATRIIQ
ncbi:type IV pilin-like G/H family protein [Anabaena sphaerica FACHB-251]|uniref:Type IV pilin-like G/H family protein n=1 Tax=Anabaena sphaerica FACHB-251 TaxID=2692883 RepID=A0A926WG20_9NOST|nr:type IV pilin-like G/H family protein [Anabaena sphaerica]MBD2293492.1 type IV pilin-like G/H family protein [Anabaena sphaerica FACHB-251]